MWNEVLIDYQDYTIIQKPLNKISFSNTCGALWFSMRNTGSKEQMFEKLLDCDGEGQSKLVSAKRKFNDLLNQEAMDIYDVWHSKMNK